MRNRKKKQQEPLYKQSLGHYYSKTLAVLESIKLEKKYPDMRLQVVYERRRRKWRKHWCLCEFVKPRKEVTRRFRLASI